MKKDILVKLLCSECGKSLSGTIPEEQGEDIWEISVDLCEKCVNDRATSLLVGLVTLIKDIIKRI
jgi:hypothetical protein